MKNQISQLTFLLLISFSLMSCGGMFQSITGEGPVMDHEISLNDFKSIRVDADWTVELIPAPEPGMIIQTEENILPYIEYSVRGGELYIRSKKSVSSKSKNIKVFFRILEEVKVENQADVFSNAIFEQKNFKAFAKNQAEISLRLWTENTFITSSNKSQIFLRGTTHTLEALAEVSGRIEAADLKANDVYAKANLSGYMKVFASDYIKIETDTDGKVDYIGNPAEVELIEKERPRGDNPRTRRDTKTETENTKQSESDKGSLKTSKKAGTRSGNR